MMALDKKNSQKYQLIIDAAVRVIARHGYHHAQVSKIAKEAGVADGTIYLYFKNKEDILVSLFRMKMGAFISTIKERMSTCSNAQEKLQQIVEMHFRQFSDQPDLSVVMQLEMRQSARDLRIQINEVLKMYVHLMEDVLQTGKEEGVFHKDLDEKLGRQMLFGTLDEMVTNWVMKERKYDLKALSRPVYEMLYAGFRNHL
ncbi:TetR/AcrR family fatty acid metabolism transcriptional regulator [Geomicrobium halophilum]|uniref:TetR/AcrR family fatty acid metabolism transcriptional regulator n=1 Tax=Geomicrobium halophilum TaxID=549000 RepID=A0A841PM48_9BACL|nr:TetR/AcrR family transcriptional regulator [Geomicrobium halophilum]MBB6448296.1 TetR/AcrR family fatty acid metabolism transcriptional regulator [Geomicrobium halophilum]